MEYQEFMNECIGESFILYYNDMEMRLRIKNISVSAFDGFNPFIDLELVSIDSLEGSVIVHNSNIVNMNESNSSLDVNCIYGNGNHNNPSYLIFRDNKIRCYVGNVVVSISDAYLRSSLGDNNFRIPFPENKECTAYVKVFIDDIKNSEKIKTGNYNVSDIKELEFQEYTRFDILDLD